MILSIPNEIETFISKCQKIVNNRFWFCEEFEFRYKIVSPADDTSEIHLFVVANDDKCVSIGFLVSIVCANVDSCVSAFVDVLNQFEQLLLSKVEKEEEEEEDDG